MLSLVGKGTAGAEGGKPPIFSFWRLLSAMQSFGSISIGQCGNRSVDPIRALSDGPNSAYIALNAGIGVALGPA